LEFSKHQKSQRKKAKTLRRFAFDAGNSNSGAVGIVISVEARSKQQATRLANAYLASFAEPIDLPVPAGYKMLGVRYAMCCVAPNLTPKDIDLDDIIVVDPLDRKSDSYNSFSPANGTLLAKAAPPGPGRRVGGPDTRSRSRADHA
jgi:hypothetical protein